MASDVPGSAGPGARDDQPLGRKIAKGAVWLVGLRLGSKIVDIVSLIILARLLSPHDFGVVAVGVSIMAAAALIQHGHFGAALIQNQQATRAHYDSAWSLKICLSSLAALALCFAAAPAAEHFADPAVEVVVSVAALKMFVDGWQNIAIVDFHKQLRFDKDVMLRFVPLVISKTIVVITAYYLRDYRALIVGMLVSSVIEIVLGYVMRPYRPRFDFSKVRALYRFSVWMQVSSVLHFVSNNAHNFVIGSLLGTPAVGVFSMANRIAMLAGIAIEGPVSQASFPAFSKKAHDRRALLDQFGLVLGYTTLLTLPTSIGIALLAPHFIPLLLGAKWLAAVPIVQILAVGIAAQSLTATMLPALMAMNRPHLVTVVQGTRMVILLPALAIGAGYYGLTGAAWGIAAVPVLMFPVRQWLLSRMFQVKTGALIQYVLRPVVASLVMALVVRLVDHQLLLGESTQLRLLELSLLVIVGAAAFLGTLGLHWFLAGRPEGPESSLLRLLRGRLRAISGAA